MRNKSILSLICLPILALAAGCGGSNSNNGGGGGGGGGNNPLVLNFGAPKTFAAGQIPANWQTITNGDFNGDGFPDIAVANGSDNNVGVFLNDGAGAFAAQVTNTTGNNPTSVLAGQLTGDSDADLITANSGGSNDTSVLLNSGSNGVFQPKTDVPLGNTPTCLALGDFDGDSDTDAVFPNVLGDLVLAKNNGSGVFATSPFSSGALLGTGSKAAAAGDMNGDGKVDVVIADTGNDRVVVWLNSGNSAAPFNQNDAAHIKQLPLPPGSGLQGIALGDLNKDNQIDIVAPNDNLDNISIFLNQGGGNFAAQPIITAGNDTFGAAIADFDLDGNPDIAISNFIGVAAGDNESNIGILLGNGDGTFKEAMYFPTGVTMSTRGITVADFNKDGKPDVATSNSMTSNISVLLNSSAP